LNGTSHGQQLKGAWALDDDDTNTDKEARASRYKTVLDGRGGMRETPVKRREKRKSFLFLCTCGIGWRSTPLCVAVAMTLPVLFVLLVGRPFFRPLLPGPSPQLTVRCGVPIYRCQVFLSSLTHWLLLLFIVPLFIFLSIHPSL
jgi:hypothetical protein